MSSASPAKIAVTCGSCSRSYSVKAELAGKTAKCGCGAALRIPAPAKVAAPASAPAEPLAAKSVVAAPPAQTRATPPAAKPAKSMMETVATSAADTAINKAAPKPVVPAFDDDEFELEAPVPIVTPVPLPNIEDFEPAPRKPVAPSNDMGDSAGLRMIGLFGFLIMGLSALSALVDTGLAIHIAVQPNVSITEGFVIFGFAALNVLIMFIMFRLGRGLVDCERSAVLGLVALYVLGMAGAVLLIAVGQQGAGVGSLVVQSLFLAPPIILGFWYWEDLRSADD